MSDLERRVGAVQQLHRVHHPRGARRATEARADLHQAPWIASGDECRARRVDVAQLRRQYGVRCLWLDEVVDPSRTAAVLGTRKGNELEFRNGAQNGERRIDDALRMKQVAGG